VVDLAVFSQLKLLKVTISAMDEPAYDVLQHA